MRFSVLASGSSGNATLVATRETSLLIDCGLSFKALKKRADEISFDLHSLDAILVTHEHGDHIGGVRGLARRLATPVYMTHGTRTAAGFEDSGEFALHEISPHESFQVGDLQVMPCPVPHDAREPCQFVVESDAARLGVLTDLGAETQHIQSHFSNCSALVLEFNHDLDLLSSCPYPDSVKSRIASRLGHFNNTQAGTLLKKLVCEKLQCVIGAHVSERANQRQLVQSQLAKALSADEIDWDVAYQHRATAWRDA